MSSENFFKELFANYKRFEKWFFRSDKEKDMTMHIKLKYQFRAMFTFAMIAMTHGLYMLVMHGFHVLVAPMLLLSVLIGYRLRLYNIMRAIFLILMIVTPPRYIPSSLVFAAPASIVFTNIHALVQTQSYRLMAIHTVLQAIIFYFYGVDAMVARIKLMNSEEITESVKLAVGYAFLAVSTNLVSLKIYHSQFTSLLRKINTLKDDLSKANNQLNVQNHKLQNNLEMKDVFIYTFSHELKNALNGMLGNLALAFDVAVIPEVRQYLSSAKVCGEILKNFVNNILDSGKLENGNLEVSPERKDVMKFLQNVWTICGRVIQNKRLNGYLEVEKNVPKYLKLDEQRMIQIILNLISNAVKFTEKGHVRIHVSWQTLSSTANSTNVILNTKTEVQDQETGLESARLLDTKEFQTNRDETPSKKENLHLVTEYQKKFMDDLNYYHLNLSKTHWSRDEVLSCKLPEGSKGILKIQVLDSGCGMSDEDQAKLFQKFSQVSSIEGQRKVGTGLGLWICKELANRLDGDVVTRSAVGVGSVFELTIRTTVPNPPEKSFSPSSSAYQSACNSPRKLYLEARASNMPKILIADDDSFNIELMKNYLNKFGIRYMCAYDGEEAVSLFKKHYKEIGFVITDNFMPKKTGTEAALEIASFLEERRQPKIPIMCISGDLKVSIDSKGITSVIQKPINFDRLKQELMTTYPQLTE